MRNQFKLYVDEYKKTFWRFPPLIAAASSISGVLVSSNISIAGYAFPPVGGLRPIAGVLCLTTIFIGFLLGSTFIKTRHTTLFTIVFGILALASIGFYLRAWQKTVVTVPVPSMGLSRSIVIGSDRTALANPSLSDEKIVHDEGDTDDRIYTYYTKDSTDTRRIHMCLIFGVLILSVTLCTASIVAGHIRNLGHPK